MRNFIGLSFAFSALASLCLGGLGACGSDSTPAIDATAPGVDSNLLPIDGPAAAADAPAGTPDGASGGMVTLTVKDYLSWCQVTINNGTPSTLQSQTVMVAPGTVVLLSATPASSTFVFGYWFGTAGDMSAAHDTNMMTTATVNADMTVQACCPFASSPSTPCGAP